MKYKKIIIIIIFIGICFPSLLLIRYNFLYESEDLEIVKINYDYYNPTTTEILSEKSFIKIIKPVTKTINKFPICILLHGDLVDSHSMNFLKSELLNNQFMVVLVDILKYNVKHYFFLNTTLNYLLTRDDVNTSQIGILGHSRGSHYALHFGSMRSESINAVICGNFGNFYNIYHDGYDIYYQNVMNNVSNIFSETPLNTSKIPEISLNNLLLSTDQLDPEHERIFNNYLLNFTGSNFNNTNIIYGNFINGTAREIYITTSIFGHYSAISHPDAIYKEVSWLNMAFGINNSVNNYQMMVFKIYLILFINILLFILGFSLVGIIYGFLPTQLKFIKKIVDKFSGRKKESKKNNKIVLVINGIKIKITQLFKEFSQSFRTKIIQFVKSDEFTLFLLSSLFIIGFFIIINMFIFPGNVYFWIIFILFMIFVPKQYGYEKKHEDAN
ncbi:MAG: alpha/beta hydrolase family protein [Promethearchaeota archaeon]